MSLVRVVDERQLLALDDADVLNIFKKGNLPGCMLPFVLDTSSG